MSASVEPHLAGDLGDGLLSTFLAAAPAAILVSEPGGRILFASARAAELFGYGPGELVGEQLDALGPEGRGGLLPGACRGRRRDGTGLALEICESELACSGRRLIIRVIRDVSADHHAEELFRALLESAPDGIVVVDRAARVRVVNGQAERLFGYSRDELLGKPIELLVPERYRAAHHADRDGYFDQPKMRPMGSPTSQLTGRRKDGSEFPVEISLSPMRTAKGMLVTAAIRDITARREVEQQLRASLREKEVLLREVHHRVKNNLQIVSSMLRLQVGQVTDPQVRELLAQSQARVRSIALFHEKLYQSKDLARVDLAAYLASLATALFANYGVDASRISLETALADVPLGIDEAICCGLIVNELISNALKHAFPGERRGSVRLTLTREGARAVLEVSDDGVGLPPGLDPGRVASLGLELVRIFTEQLRGTLVIDRARGTRVQIGFDAGGRS